MGEITYKIKEGKIHGNNWRNIRLYHIYVEGVDGGELPLLKNTESVNRVHGYYSVHTTELTQQEVLEEFISLYGKRLEELIKGD